MLLSTGKAFTSEDWLAEIKYDGVRLMAEWGGGAPARLKSRNGANATTWFPEITSGLGGVGRGRFVIDGEACVMDDIGRSDFNKTIARTRMRGFRPGADHVVYCVFDLLVDSGRSVMALPLIERKRRLARLLRGKPPSILLVSDFEGGGAELYGHALSLKLEGVVLKKKDSIYLPGERSPHWIKCKRPGATPAQRFHRDPV